jgi:gamma-glutamylcyclotransferase (GGCT)/AIG2-like uncharacterized protein YtfP
MPRALRIEYPKVTKGKTSDVVAQCRNIHTAATENLTALAKYGVTATTAPTPVAA